MDAIAARLMAEILADPADEGPRLVYADHVGGLRGELIQVQCAEARLDPDDPARRPLRQRADQLLAAHEEAWTRDLWPLMPHEGHFECFEWRRGFVEHVEIDRADLEDLEAIRALTPLQSIVAELDSIEHYDALERGGLADMTAVEIPSSDRDGVVWKRFCALPRRNSVRRLAVCPSRVADVIATPTLREVRALDVASDAAEVRLLRELPQLSEVRIRGLSAEIDVIDALAELGGVRGLDLWTRIGQPACERLGAGTFPALRTLTLSSSSPEELPAEGLRGLRFESLVALDLGTTRLDDAATAMVFQTCHLPRLRSLITSWNSRCGEAGLAALTDSGLLSRLETLKLTLEPAVDPAALLAAAPSLTRLDLTWTPRAAAALARSDVAARLERLALDVDSDGLASLELPALRVLEVTTLDDAAALALARSPGLPALRRLRIGHAALTEVGFRALAESSLVDRLARLYLSFGAAPDRPAALLRSFGPRLIGPEGYVSGVRR